MSDAGSGATVARGRPLRLLYVGTLPPHPGGSALTCHLLLEGLAGLGHDIVAIAPITADALRSGDPVAGEGNRIDVSRFVMPYLDITPHNPPSGEYRQLEASGIERLFGQAVARERPDVLIIGRESFAEHAAPLAGLHSLPSIQRFVGSTTIALRDGSYPAELGRRMLGCFRRADVRVTPARHMQRALAELGFGDVQVIPNPVDLERFRPMPCAPELRRQLDIDESALVVAHVSNLKAIKRPLDIAAAAEMALREESRMVFVVVGDGPCRAELEEACSARGLAASFRFTGWVDYERVPGFISCADIVLMPSAVEGQSRVYLETQASGRTLVASDIPAAREVIEGGETGLLFRTGDTHHLAAQLLVAVRNPELRARIGRQARRRAAAHSVPRVASAYSDLLATATQVSSTGGGVSV
jgi:glycosyltransferase involved in cell wall biosynthesis